MAHFRPSRASPPLRAPAVPSSRVSEFTDNSHPPTAPELVGLSAEEIDFINEVVGRTPATASTFLTVFKAYNDVLQDRGLDPQNEVVYYGKLLKIGTLKGKNWADKWDMVKEQQGYVPKAGASAGGGRTTRVSRTTPTPSRPSAKVPYPSREPDTFTLHSHQENTEDDLPTRPAINRRYPDTNGHDTPRPIRRFGSPATVVSSNSLGLDTGPHTETNPSDILRRLAARARTAAVPRWDADTAAETNTQASSVPPSYGAVVRDETPAIPYKDKGKGKEMSSARGFGARHEPSPPTPTQPLPKQPPLLQQRERRGSVVNAEDAFRRVKEVQDEETAAQFYNDRLVERCYEVWKQGYEWIITTGEQIADARDSLILRRTLLTWRNRTAQQRELCLRVAALSDRRWLKRFYYIWKHKDKERKHHRKQLEWREDMRARMKTVRERGELRLKKDMWSMWRQSYLSRLAEQQFSRRVLARFFDRWKARLRKLDELEAAADYFEHDQDEKLRNRLWDAWRHRIEMHHVENTITARVNLRIMTNAMDIWRRTQEQYHIAERFNNMMVLKHTLCRWQAARARIQAMENRAVKHVARQHALLVRAIMRIWKAHERGQLLTRVKALRLLKQAWTQWRRRMEEQREREELAQLFRTRSTSLQGASVLKRWREVYQSHQNAQSFAVHYDRERLQYQMMLTWRLQLRAHLRKAKQAKVARKYFVLRRCFHVWTAKVEEKRREKKLREFQMRKAKKVLEEWHTKARQQRLLKLAEQEIRTRVALRIVTNALRHWTTRVADLKFRELETIQHRDQAVIFRAYEKWKAVCKRHVHELSLMESYQDVKRAENMRKVFVRWLTAARKARHRRLHLQEKEEEFKLMTVASAFDKWRERYMDIRLQPLADSFIRQQQTDLVIRAFTAWKRKSLLPTAVKVYNYNLKKAYWAKWKKLMPQALQAKAAREMDRRNTLGKAFALWRKVQKKKIEHKAINYARYLELLSSGPRQAPAAPRGTALAPRARNVFPARRAIRPTIPTEDETEEPPRAASSASRAPFTRPSTNPSRTGIPGLLANKPRTASPERARKPRSPERPRFSSRRTIPRDPSPSETEPEPAPPAYGGGISAWRKDIHPLSTTKSAPPSVAGDVLSVANLNPGRGRSSLWQELKEVRRRPRSRAPTECTYSPEPP
ncbi:hypothetical protein LXA43DRAFT_697884 [Ganoderma leucocontextum]|nr:hypothetical protein LXA43DRAFT_697884 [Ganoderma leucocontextum]